MSTAPRNALDPLRPLVGSLGVWCTAITNPPDVARLMRSSASIMSEVSRVAFSSIPAVIRAYVSMMTTFAPVAFIAIHKASTSVELLSIGVRGKSYNSNRGGRASLWWMLHASALSRWSVGRSAAA